MQIPNIPLLGVIVKISILCGLSTFNNPILKANHRNINKNKILLSKKKKKFHNPLEFKNFLQRICYFVVIL